MAEFSERDLVNQAKKYLVFDLADTLYGVPLLSVREVVEPDHIKPMPNSIDYFLGLINIRGEIIGVIDLRIKFGLEPLESKSQVFIIFETPVGPMAAVVDRVCFVASLKEEDIEKNPKVITDVPSDNLEGIAKYDGSLITLVKLNEVLGLEVFTEMRTMRKVSG